MSLDGVEYKGDYEPTLALFCSQIHGLGRLEGGSGARKGCNEWNSSNPIKASRTSSNPPHHSAFEASIVTLPPMGISSRQEVLPSHVTWLWKQQCVTLEAGMADRFILPTGSNYLKGLVGPIEGYSFHYVSRSLVRTTGRLWHSPGSSQTRNNSFQSHHRNGRITDGDTTEATLKSLIKMS